MELWFGFTGTPELVRLSPSPLLSTLWEHGQGSEWSDEILLNAVLSDKIQIYLVRCEFYCILCLHVCLHVCTWNDVRTTISFFHCPFWSQTTSFRSTAPRPTVLVRAWAIILCPFSQLVPLPSPPASLMGAPFVQLTLRSLHAVKSHDSSFTFLRMIPSIEILKSYLRTTATLQVIFYHNTFTWSGCRATASLSYSNFRIFVSKTLDFVFHSSMCIILVFTCLQIGQTGFNILCGRQIQRTWMWRWKRNM